MIQDFEKDNKEKPVDYAFSILNTVAQGDATKWSIVYDITARQVHFITNMRRDRKSFSLSDFNYSCNQLPKAFNLSASAKGNISSLFSLFTSKDNRKLIEKSAEESRSRINLKKETINEVVKLYSVQKCSK